MKRKKNKRLQRLKKSITLRIGILGCSLFILFLNSFPRSYEIQFHTISLHNKLDYARLKRMGIGKIIYIVFNDGKGGGGLHFRNSQFKTATPALEQLGKEFDFSNMQLCAWMITRSFRWLDRTELFDYRYVPGNGNLEMIRKLDIFNPAVVQKLIAVYRELASKKINCILIQDDFILRYNEGLSQWGKAQFTLATEVPAREKLMVTKGTPYNLRWNSIKVDYLNKLLQLIIRKCKGVNSAVKIGMNIHYETPVYPAQSKAWYAHSLEKILQTGIDYIYLMSYHRQIKDEMNFSDNQTIIFFKELVEKAYRLCKDRLIVKIQIRDFKSGRRIPADEIKVYLSLVPPGVQRVCFTPVKLEDFDYLEKLIGGTAKNAKGREEKR